MVLVRILVRPSQAVSESGERRWAVVRGEAVDGDAAISRDVLDRGRPMAYTMGVEFEWDNTKNDACFELRGFDFAYAVRAFLDPHRTVAQDRRRDYGEDRYRLLGMIDGRT